MLCCNLYCIFVRFPLSQVLKLIHGRVVDTAALFPHPSGLPFKHALKKLAKEFLHKDIQDGAGMSCCWL